MKKLLHLCLALAFASAMVGTEAMAGNKAPKVKAPKVKEEKVKEVKEVKVDVCHIIEANDVIPFGPAPVYLSFGKVINVAEDAVDAHLEHGDSTAFWSGDAAAGPINIFREAGAHLPAANCFYGVNGLDGSTVPQ